MKLVFAADIAPTKSNEQYFIEGNAEYLFGPDLLDYMENADFRCFNLEVPLTEKEIKVYYPGPHLIANPKTINAIKKINPSLLTIGNNHALDQGEEGCLSTMSVLNSAGIPFTGAGKILKKAREPFFTSVNGVMIGIYNCSEYEFAAATDCSCGANPYDPLVSFDHVKAMKDKCDVLIVLYHGGKEFYRYPSPRLQRVCRKFADFGADVVICQHTHCIGCEEKYNNSTIVYGQGNFLFDRNEDDFKRTGMFVEINVKLDSKDITVNYFPFIKQSECVRLADEEKCQEIMLGFKERSEEILKPGFLNKKYEELADQYYEKYIAKLIGKNIWIKILNRLQGRKLYKHFYNRESALSALNVISPENHYELFMQGLRNVAYKK